MGQKLLKYYDEAKKLGGLTAQIRLAVITKIPGNKAEAAPDSSENLAKFDAGINEIKKNLNQSKKQI